ncbi:hypothetical protein O3P69_012502, partial [Scylla paramamosain]
RNWSLRNFQTPHWPSQAPAVLAQWHKTGRTWCLSTSSFWLSWRRKQPLTILRRITSLQSTARRACLSCQYSPADRFDRNRQCRGNFRHQDYRKEGGCRDQGEYRGHGNYRDRGNYRDHRREYSDHRQGRFVSDHRDHDDSRRDSEKRKYRSEKERSSLQPFYFIESGVWTLSGINTTSKVPAISSVNKPAVGCWEVPL